MSSEIKMSEDRKSPSIVVEQANEPEEAAHQEIPMENQVPTIEDEEMEEIASILPDGILTKEMVEEEKHLHQETIEEEKKLQEKAHEEMEKELKEQRYKRLQHLLQKSSIYTNFLLMKMEEQQDKERKRQARLEAKRAKMEEKRRAEMEEKERAEREEREKAERETQKGTDEPDGGCSMELESSQGAESQNSQASEPSTRRRIGTRGQTKRNQKEATPKTDDANATKKGQKRKAESKSYNIAEVLNKQELESKRRKIGDGSDKGIPAAAVQSNSTKESKGKAEGEMKKAEVTADTFSRVINGERVTDKQPGLFSGGVLRPYQIEGMEWLKVLYENGVNGILADEMGLGKTVQCIALFAHLVNMGVPGPFLIVAPLSTLPNWLSEFQRFTPKVPTVLYHGSIDDRFRRRRDIGRKHGERQTHPVVITSYEICMNDRQFLQYYEWKYIIVDEGHRIKNLNCRLIRELKLYRSANRLLLTGTPLQNNLAELWSMLNFLIPEVFDDLHSFESWFDFQSLTAEGGNEAVVAQEREQNILSMLHQILTPFLLRRLKTDVELFIPPKKEVLVYAPLTKLQHYYYKATVDRTILHEIEAKKKKSLEVVELNEKGRPKRRSTANPVNYKAMLGDDKQNDDIVAWFQQFTKNAGATEKLEETPKVRSEINIKLQNVMMQLRKCCNHPYLLEYPINPKTDDYLIDEKLVQASGKILLLERLLPALKERGHKILIFSQMTSMLDILQDYCYIRSYTFCRLDGSMSYTDRQEQIEEFNKNKDMFLFLLSTRAGGLGINLVAADTVIIYDSDWNPQSDLQAQDRCHRIGQDKPVVVYRLVTSNTIDQKIVQRAAAKRKLEKMVMHQGKFKGGVSNMEKDSKSVINPKELLELLQSEDHDGVLKSDSNHWISDEDLEKLLDRSDLRKEQNDRELEAESSSVFQVIKDDSGKSNDISLSV
ncbi:lymphocyte-specific helicase-like [Ptychodera flava]|uniref:lymphocyte-specific helicase-like n=1 Tax=Ptychodera flava TaxID=63121 RepID=UPI00396A3611